MIASVARNCIYLPVQHARGEHITACLKQARAFNRMPPARQRQLQWDNLKALLLYLDRQNQYYHGLFDKNSVRVEGLEAFDDLNRIPFLTKEIIQSQSDSMASDRRCRYDLRSTSGSTGVPLHFTKDRQALAHMNAVMHDAYSWHGIEIGDRHARIWGVPLSSLGRRMSTLKDRLLNRRRLNAFDINRESCLSFFDALRKFRPKYIYGLPGYMLEFAETVARAGRDPSDLNLKILIATGEILHPGQRTKLKELFNCPIANEYGMTECGIIAFECARGNMHLMNHHVHVELIDPDTGRPVEPGERGEVVITELHGIRMPFIRYRTGDLAAAGDLPCPCGLNTPTIDKLEGRIADMIVTPEGKKVAGAILDYAFSRGVRRFRAYQHSKDRLEVLIEKGHSFTTKDIEAIHSKWRDYLGVNMKIEFELVERVPPDPGGKLRCVVSEIL